MNLFPLDSTIDLVDIKMHPVRWGYMMKPCDACGALVPPSKQEKHIEFHQKLAEIVEVLGGFEDAVI